MFNKLVISATERRKQRTARFFCGTAVFYMLSVAIAFAVSIIASNPNLADTSDHSVLMVTPPMPIGVEGSRPVGRPPASNERRNDPTHINELGTVIATNPAPRPSLTPQGPPGIARVGAGDGGPGGGGDVVGWSGPVGPDTGVHDSIAPPPRPPEPPAPAQVKPADNRPVKVPSHVLQGKAILRRTPDYPPLAKQIRLEGSVSVEVIISLDGRVESARAVSGHEIFRLTAEKAAEGWRFEPTYLNGAAVRVTGVIVFNFRMQ
ncbi:MAG TPA: energy transducer TonB [Blastocatellia bacterium]|nr:energy transducer TonB [Blastocatellia bacterium]